MMRMYGCLKHYYKYKIMYMLFVFFSIILQYFGNLPRSGMSRHSVPKRLPLQNNLPQIFFSLGLPVALLNLSPTQPADSLFPL